jgi:hypothetical protein
MADFRRLGEILTRKCAKGTRKIAKFRLSTASIYLFSFFFFFPFRAFSRSLFFCGSYEGGFCFIIFWLYFLGVCFLFYIDFDNVFWGSVI